MRLSAYSEGSGFSSCSMRDDTAEPDSIPAKS